MKYAEHSDRAHRIRCAYFNVENKIQIFSCIRGPKCRIFVTILSDISLFCLLFQDCIYIYIYIYIYIMQSNVCDKRWFPSQTISTFEISLCPYIKWKGEMKSAEHSTGDRAHPIRHVLYCRKKDSNIFLSCLLVQELDTILLRKNRGILGCTNMFQTQVSLVQTIS